VCNYVFFSFVHMSWIKLLVFMNLDCWRKHTQSPSIVIKYTFWSTLSLCSKGKWKPKPFPRYIWMKGRQRYFGLFDKLKQIWQKNTRNKSICFKSWKICFDQKQMTCIKSTSMHVTPFVSQCCSSIWKQGMHIIILFNLDYEFLTLQGVGIWNGVTNDKN